MFACTFDMCIKLLLDLTATQYDPLLVYPVVCPSVRLTVCL